MKAMIVTDRILAKKTAFTGNAQRPYLEIPTFGNDLDPKGNHIFMILHQAFGNRYSPGGTAWCDNY